MASADYISREAVVNAINSTPFTMSMFLNEDQCVGARQARDSLALIVKKSIPAADVRPVVHGRWIWSEGGKRVCSECGNVVALCGNVVAFVAVGTTCVSWKEGNFCPNCGAWMEES